MLTSCEKHGIFYVKLTNTCDVSYISNGESHIFFKRANTVAIEEVGNEVLKLYASMAEARKTQPVGARTRTEGRPKRGLGLGDRQEAPGH